MPTYVTLYKLTDQGAKDIKTSPERVGEAIKAYEAMGGKVLGVYTLMGEYDFVAIGEAPNDQAAAAHSLSLASQGNVKSTTMRAFTPAEWAEIVKKLP